MKTMDNIAERIFDFIYDITIPIEKAFNWFIKVTAHLIATIVLIFFYGFIAFGVFETLKSLLGDTIAIAITLILLWIGLFLHELDK